MFTFDNRKYFDCTLSERVSCRELIQILSGLADTIKGSDVSEFESEVERHSIPFLSYVAGLYLDGLPASTIRQIGEARMVASQKIGLDLLMQLLILEGILSIQSGDEAYIVEEKLFAYLGDDVQECRRRNDYNVSDIYSEARWADERTPMNRLIYLIDAMVKDTQMAFNDFDIESLSNDALYNLCIYLSPEISARLLSYVSLERKAAVLCNLANAVVPDLSVLHSVRSSLNSLYASGDPDLYRSTDNLQIVADIVNCLKSSEAYEVMSALEDDDYARARDIERKRISFDFILGLDERSFMRLYREVDMDTWTLALKIVPPDAVDSLLSRMSARMSNNIRSDMEDMANVSESVCVAAQQKIFEVLHNLRRCGDIL